MFLAANAMVPILAGLLIAIAVHLAILCLAELIMDGVLTVENVAAGSAAALSLLRGVAVLLAGLGIAGFVVPGGIAMGIVLVALSILGFSRIGR